MKIHNRNKIAKENQWIENIFDKKPPAKVLKKGLDSLGARHTSLNDLKLGMDREKLQMKMFTKKNYEETLANLVS